MEEKSQIQFLLSSFVIIFTQQIYSIFACVQTFKTELKDKHKCLLLLCFDTLQSFTFYIF